MTYEQRVLALAAINDPDHLGQRYIRDKEAGKFWWDLMVSMGWATAQPHTFFEDTTIYTVTDAGEREARKGAA